MRIINRTIYGSALQTALFFDIPLEVKPNTTLNEKFGILENFTIEEGTRPKVQYMCIGNGGHKFVTDADQIPYSTPIEHKASDAALYNHLPFVLREVSNDLTITQRERYALRKEVTIAGVDYYAYYLKRLTLEEQVQTMNYISIQNGNENITEFVPSTDVLSPEHPAITNDSVENLNANYLSTSVIVDLTFNEWEVQELINVAEVMYGSSDKAIISEIGLCSGIDKVTTGSLVNDTVNYKEAVAVQVASFISGYYTVGYSNQGFELEIEAGATEPLI